MATGIDEIKERIEGLPIALNRTGRRFLMEGFLDRLIDHTHKIKPYYVYLFSDIIVYAERRKKAPHKYVAHKYLANCLFVDYADSSKGTKNDPNLAKSVTKLSFLRKDKKDFCLKYAFEIKNTEVRKVVDEGVQEKEEYIFLAKNLEQKNLWKQDIERQINDALDEEGVISDPARSPAFGAYLNVFSDGNDDSTYGSAGSSSELTTEPEDIASSVSTTPGSETSSISSLTEAWGAQSDQDPWSGDADGDEVACDELDELQIHDTPIIGNAEDGSLVIQAASVQFIAWVLVYGDHQDTSLINAFLFTYRTFVTSIELFDILKGIYHKNFLPPKELVVKYADYDTRKKVASFLRIWVSRLFSEDFDKKTLYCKLIDFLKEMPQTGCLKDANDIKLAMLKANKDRIYRKIERKKKSLSSGPEIMSSSSVSFISSTVPSFPSFSPTGEVWTTKFIEFSLSSVADYLTHSEHVMYQQVSLNEFAKMAWQDPKHSKKLAPNILLYTGKFNNISQWVSTEIIQGSTVKQRAMMIERFVSLAKKCVELNNYNTLMEILAGINRGHVDRLKKSWAAVSSSTMDTLQELNDLMDPKLNFRNYREALRKAALPALPYFGIFLRDIVFTEEGNGYKSGELVNYERIQILARIYNDVTYFQKGRYPACEDDTICTYFKQLWVYPDEVLYHHSRLAEPSAAKRDLSDPTPSSI